MRSVTWLTLACLSLGAVKKCDAFAPPKAPATAALVSRSFGTISRMSSLPNETKPKDWRDRLPPSPEDQLVMTGDIVALFVYSFLDHSLNEAYVNMVQNNMDPSSLDPLGDLSANQLPVWFDAMHNTMSPEHLLTILGLAGVSYSPAIATAGAASVAICTCWLLSGYVHQAFSFRNTLECNTSTALWVTGKTWFTASILMVLLALGSDYYCGHNCGCSMGGLTKADADYIFDSLSVLVSWRFVFSAMLGYGK